MHNLAAARDAQKPALLISSVRGREERDENHCMSRLGIARMGTA